MKESTPWLRLPLSFDTPALMADLELSRASRWRGHYNDQAHAGNWQCVALRSASGRADDIDAREHDDFHDTPLLEHCAFLRQVTDSFLCEKKAVRLMALEAGARILPHRDRGGSIEDGLARIHVPIQTDPAVVFTIDGEDVHFEAGGAWYMNANCLHAVRNDGQRERVHLVLDCVPNPWLAGLFAASGWSPRPAPKYGDPSITDDNVREVIAVLRGAGHATAIAMAARLQSIASEHKS